MIRRHLSPLLHKYLKYNPVLFINGPRQSGKTTLVKKELHRFAYISLENPDILAFLENDPRGFIENIKLHSIIDEAQKFPLLFNYLQSKVDSTPGIKIVLTGSQNFLMHEGISQSLAGRTGLLTLLPLTNLELSNSKYSSSLKDWTFIATKGHYPGIYDRSIPSSVFYNAYVSTYIERDIRLIKNIGNLSDFYRFVKLCAGRSGQILNVSSLASDTGISPNTAMSWISILEASYILFRLQPYHKNFNKRLVKSPKLYFYDTGLLCYLLDIKNVENVETHYAKGAIFENLIISEIAKYFYNKGQRPPIHFWRSQKGKEVDLIIDINGSSFNIEIKSGRTWNLSYFDNLRYWQKLAGTKPDRSYVIFGGSETDFLRKDGTLLSWDRLFDPSKMLTPN